MSKFQAKKFYGNDELRRKSPRSRSTDSSTSMSISSTNRLEETTTATTTELKDRSETSQAEEAQSSAVQEPRRKLKAKRSPRNKAANEEDSTSDPPPEEAGQQQSQDGQGQEGPVVPLDANPQAGDGDVSGEAVVNGENGQADSQNDSEEDDDPPLVEPSVEAVFQSRDDVGQAVNSNLPKGFIQIFSDGKLSNYCYAHTVIHSLANIGTLPVGLAREIDKTGCEGRDVGHRLLRLAALRWDHDRSSQLLCQEVQKFMKAFRKVFDSLTRFNIDLAECSDNVNVSISRPVARPPPRHSDLGFRTIPASSWPRWCRHWTRRRMSAENAKILMTTGKVQVTSKKRTMMRKKTILMTILSKISLASRLRPPVLAKTADM